MDSLHMSDTRDFPPKKKPTINQGRTSHLSTSFAKVDTSRRVVIPGVIPGDWEGGSLIRVHVSLYICCMLFWYVKTCRYHIIKSSIHRIKHNNTNWGWWESTPQKGTSMCKQHKRYLKKCPSCRFPTKCKWINGCKVNYAMDFACFFPTKIRTSAIQV